MRTYQPIWNKIKSEGYCKVECSPHLVSRVRRAVFKEKDQDLIFKAQCSKKGIKCKLLSIETSTGLFFVMEQQKVLRHFL
jgi:hypothetical protein